MRNVSLKLGWMIVAGAVAAFSSSLTALAQAGAVDTVVQLKAVNTELQGKLDAKSAKVGDKVVVKTITEVKIGDGTDIPKGTKLIGHVTDVQARAGNAESRIAVNFDQAELKGGQTVAIRAVIESLQAPPDLAAANGIMTSANGGGGSSGGGGGSHGGGGAVGGMAHGPTGGGANTSASASGVTDATHPTDAASTAGSSVHQVPGYADGVTAQDSGINGVLLASDATGAKLQSASGIFFAAKKNVRIEDGTQVALAVTTASGDSK